MGTPFDVAKFIEDLGGTNAVARHVRLRPPSVSGWKESGRIPDGPLIRLAVRAEKLGVATRKQLFPDDFNEIWPELAANEVRT
jgi:hypothetical protein